MLDKDITVLKIVEDAFFDPSKGVSAPRIRVEFKVGDHGPFTERFDKKDYTALNRDAKLNAYAKEVRVPA